MNNVDAELKSKIVQITRLVIPSASDKQCIHFFKGFYRKNFEDKNIALDKKNVATTIINDNREYHTFLKGLYIRFNKLEIAEFNRIANNVQHLSYQQTQQLLSLLHWHKKNYELFFGG